MANSSELAAIQAENARLIALLETHGIEWRLPQSVAVAAQESEPSRLSTAEKVALSAVCFAGAQMFTQSAGKARPQVNQAMPRPALTSGAPVSVKSRASSVAIAATAC